jgi:hypothetical protein
MSLPNQSFICATCGTKHHGLPSDIGFAKPGAYFSVPARHRDSRCALSSDTCVIDGRRFFIRGILYVPLRGTRRSFGWGFWAEVSGRTFKRYLQLYDADGSKERRYAGKLSVEDSAHEGYEGVDGLGVTIQFGPADERPVFTLRPSRHLLYREQRDGIMPERHHEILEPLLRAKPPLLGTTQHDPRTTHA